MVRIAALCVLRVPLSAEKITALKRPALAIHHFRRAFGPGSSEKVNLQILRLERCLIVKEWIKKAMEIVIEVFDVQWLKKVFEHLP